MKKRYAVILAAGQGTRMKSKLYKVLHPILGKPMVQYVLEALKTVSVDRLITVVGHGADEVKSVIGKDSEFVLQAEQLGTAHAVIQAESLLQNEQGTTIVVCGDTPLITEETLQQLFDHHEKNQAKATILTTKVDNPTGYGRIIRDEAGKISRIVEEKDATNEEKAINEINTGTYCFDNEFLFQALKKIDNDNAQQEYYLTDVIEILKNEGEIVTAYVTEDDTETIGINDRLALANAENIMKRRINERHLLAGVTMMDPNNTYIGPDVSIEQDVVIYPGTMITGKSYIHTGAIIGPNSEIEDSIIGQGTTVRQSVVKHSQVGNEVNVGPFAHIRPESEINDKARIGNFVEIKKSKVGYETKVPHHSYIGDAILGDGINIGCGTITVNFDGFEKHQTIVGDHSFIGCNANLVAPVMVEAGAYVAAGSTITKDVPADALAIARARQENKENYVKENFSRK